MAIEIKIENSVVNGSSIATGVNGLTGDAKITVCGTELDNTQLYSNINVNQFCAQIESCQELVRMSSEEYASLQKVLAERKNKKRFVDALFRHLLSFAEGVAINVVSNCITK